MSDNGIGKSAETDAAKKGGLGTSLVTALAQQLDAEVETVNSPHGLKVSIIRASLNSQLAAAA